jgi:hypothetical protein
MDEETLPVAAYGRHVPLPAASLGVRVGSALVAIGLTCSCASTVLNPDGTAAGSGTSTGNSFTNGAAADGTQPVQAGGSAAQGQQAVGPGGGLQGTSSAPQSGSAGGGAPGTTAEGTESNRAVGGIGGSSAPGVTATTIAVGIPYAVNSEGAHAAFGANGVSGGNERAQYEAVVKDINDHGGILGRKVVPVWHPVDASSTQTYDQKYAAACADFTEDHKVFAALAPATDNFLACTGKAGVRTIWGDLAEIADDELMRRFPLHTTVGAPTLDRLAAIEAQVLVAQGYFKGNAKVGVVSYDSPRYAGVMRKVFLPALARAGIKVDPANVAYAHKPNGYGEYGQTSSDASSAVLRLNGNGVDHVVIFDSAGLLTTFFMTNARSQRYFPRYGLNSMNGVQALIDTGALQSGDVHGAVGTGWVPLLDIPYNTNPPSSPYSNKSRVHCTDLMRKTGHAPTSSNNENVQQTECDHLYFLKAVLTAAGGNAITRDSFERGLAALGGTYVSAVTFRTYFSPAQHTGVDAVRPFVFSEDCSCMRYVGSLMSLPRR